LMTTWQPWENLFPPQGKRSTNGQWIHNKAPKLCSPYGA
jgi:hypothetical protein